MATDPNITRIKFLRSKTANAKPTAASIDEGELAINLADRTIFSKNGTVVVDLGFGKGGVVDGAINQTTGGFTTTGTVTAPTFTGALNGNANSATKWLNARAITLTGNNVSGNTTIDGTTNVTLPVIVNSVTATQAQLKFDVNAADAKHGLSIDWVDTASGFPSFGTVLTAKGYAAGGSALQLYVPYGASYGGSSLRYRHGLYAAGTPWTDLKTLMDDENFNRWVPDKTGSGASGSWNINSASATKLQTPRSINGTLFDGTANITVGQPIFSSPLASFGITNINDIAPTGGVEFRYGSSSAANKAPGTDHAYLSMAFNNQFNSQIAVDWRTATMYTRGKSSGTWGNWSTQLDSTNFNDYAVPLTGGTMTGQLSVPSISSSGALGIYSGPSVAGSINVGDVLISNSFADRSKVPTNGLYVKGNTIIGADLTVEGRVSSTGGYVAIDKRSLKPIDTNSSTFTPYFTSTGGLTGTADSSYADFISLNTYADRSGGMANGLAFRKGTKRILHYQAAVDATTWGIASTIAYLDDNVASATKLQTARTINNVPFDGTTNIEVPIKTIRTTAIETGDLSESVFFRSDAGSGTLGIHIHNPADSKYAYQLSQDSSYNSIGLKARVKSNNVWSDYKSLAFTDSDITGNAASASILQTARTLSITGDATGSTSFNGSANVSTALTLANSGVVAGTYKSVTVDAKGRVTNGKTIVTSLVTATTAAGTGNTATTNANTYLNIVENVGGTVSSVGSSTQITGVGTVTVTSDAAGKLTITGAQSVTGNAGSATKLLTGRAIGITGSGASGSVVFDGTANVNIPLVVATQATATNNTTIATTAFVQAVNSADTGSAATALKLKTARTIALTGNATGSVVFDGSANVSINTVIPKASVSVEGLVKLNNTLASTSTTEALTAAQGKALSDSTAAAISLANAKWFDETSTHVSGTQYTNTLNYPIKVYAMSTYGGGSDPVQRIDVTNPAGTLSRSWTNEATVPSGYKYTLVNSGGGGWTNLVQVIIVK